MNNLVESKDLKDKLLEWDTNLAVLDDFQLEILTNLEDILTADTRKISDLQPTKNDVSSLAELNDTDLCIESTQEFLSWYNQIDDKILEQFDSVYLEYFNQLSNKTEECDNLLKEVS